MADLADQLYQIYTAEIYPLLEYTDPEYRRLLAQIKPFKIVPQKYRSSFEQGMKMQAWLAATKVRSYNSLKPSSIRATVLPGRQTLYRVTSKPGPGEKAWPGIWWFNETVAERCRAEAGSNVGNRLQWLRNVLAVCYNFPNTFDHIQLLKLNERERLPAVLGEGLPMPHYQLIENPNTGSIQEPPKDYWQKKGETLLGGEEQIVLPWIPEARIDNKTQSL